jgi:hypothetical protein
MLSARDKLVQSCLIANVTTNVDREYGVLGIVICYDWFGTETTIDVLPPPNVVRRSSESIHSCSRVS